MVNAHRNALEKLWKDVCTVVIRKELTDPRTKLTGFEETTLLQDQPCKLSFEALSSGGGDELPTAAQAVKLFLPPEVEIPPSSKIIVKRQQDPAREFTYQKSGLAGVFSNHQELLLEAWRGWA